MSMKRRVLVLLSAWLVLILEVQAWETRTYQLYHRQASELATFVEPMLPKGSQVKAAGDVLVIRTTAQGFKEVGLLIRKLDRMPQSLQISVQRGERRLGERRGRVRTYETYQNNEDRVYTVRALEGKSVFISLGKQVPVTYINPVWGGRGHQLLITHSQTSSGFYATPRIIGSRVALAIQVRHSKFTRANAQAIEDELIETEVEVPLNKWVALGGAYSQQDRQVARHARVLSTQSRRRSDTTIYIKVEKIKMKGSIPYER